MSDVLVAFVTGSFSLATAAVMIVLGARVSGKLKRVDVKIDDAAADAKATKEQVVNGHKTNLREESDERHSENTGLLRRIASDIGYLLYITDTHTDQIEELTHPKHTTGKHS